MTEPLVTGVPVGNIDAQEEIYLDGAIGSQEAYLHLAGEGILISSGKPMQKGNYQ